MCVAGCPDRIVVLKNQMQHRDVIEAAALNDPEWVKISANGNTVTAYANEDRDLRIFDLEAITLRLSAVGCRLSAVGCR